MGDSDSGHMASVLGGFVAKPLLVMASAGLLAVLLVGVVFWFSKTGRWAPVGERASSPAVFRIQELPPPALEKVPLVEALSRRSSARTFHERALEDQILSNLLWAADGINRPETGARTAPTAYDWRHMDLYVFQEAGVARYDAEAHALEWFDSTDRRPLTGMQDFVATAPLNLVIVSDEDKMDDKEPKEMRTIFTGVASGAIAQNVYLYCAAAGLHVVVRGSVEREPLHRYLGLGAGQKVVVAQSIGHAP